MIGEVVEGEPIAIFTGEIHPYADRWPMRTPDEIESMAESIRANGQRFPIILTPEGVLVDGRNRLRACEIADIPPFWEVRTELDCEDAIVAFIWDANGDRRDMSKGAKAMLAALRPGTGLFLGKTHDVSNVGISKARQVIEFCDETVIEAVIAGALAFIVERHRPDMFNASVQGLTCQCCSLLAGIPVEWPCPDRAVIGHLFPHSSNRLLPDLPGPGSPVGAGQPDGVPAGPAG